MFVDELGRLTNGIKKDRKGIEAAYHSPQLHATNEVDRDTDVLFANLIQKDVL